MAIGLNAVREICARTPLVMDATLLSDLVAYANDRNKGVAVRSPLLVPRLC